MAETNGISQNPPPLHARQHMDDAQRQGLESKRPTPMPRKPKPEGSTRSDVFKQAGAPKRPPRKCDKVPRSEPATVGPKLHEKALPASEVGLEPYTHAVPPKRAKQPGVGRSLRPTIPPPPPPQPIVNTQLLGEGSASTYFVNSDKHLIQSLKKFVGHVVRGDTEGSKMVLVNLRKSIGDGPLARQMYRQIQSQELDAEGLGKALAEHYLTVSASAGRPRQNPDRKADLSYKFTKIFLPLFPDTKSKDGNRSILKEAAPRLVDVEKAYRQAVRLTGEDGQLAGGLRHYLDLKKADQAVAFAHKALGAPSAEKQKGSMFRRSPFENLKKLMFGKSRTEAQQSATYAVFDLHALRDAARYDIERMLKK